MNIPENLRYTPYHLWVELQPDGTARAGITDHAQETLGDIVFTETPASGTTIEMGAPCGVVESVKTASDLHAPLSGSIIETNEAIQTSPERINESPYEAWIFRLRPKDPAQFDQLLDAAGYRRLLDQ